MCSLSGIALPLCVPGGESGAVPGIFSEGAGLILTVEAATVKRPDMTQKEDPMQTQTGSLFLVVGVMTLVVLATTNPAPAQQPPPSQTAGSESAPIPPDRIPQPIRDAVNAPDRPAT